MKSERPRKRNRFIAYFRCANSKRQRHDAPDRSEHFK